MQRAWLAGVLVTLLCGVFSGCLGSDPALLNVTTVPLDAPSQTGDGEFVVRLLAVVETANGTPVPGAAVAIHPIPKPATAPGINELVRRNTSMVGRTGPDGVLHAHLREGLHYSFIVQAPNLTLEARHIVQISQEFTDKPLIVVLFHTFKTAEVAGTLAARVGTEPPNTGGFASRCWFPREVVFHEDPQTNRQYVFRLFRAETRLAYALNPGEMAELGIKVGFASPGEEAKLYWEMRGYNPPVGPAAPVRLALEAPQLAWGDTVKNAQLRAGPTSGQSIVAPNGLKYTITVDATFATDPVLAGVRPYVSSPGLLPNTC